MYGRHDKDQKKMEQLNKKSSFVVRFDEKRGVWKRYPRYEYYTLAKKYARRAARRHLKNHDIYEKQVYDLWWDVW